MIGRLATLVAAALVIGLAGPARAGLPVYWSTDSTFSGGAADSEPPGSWNSGPLPTALTNYQGFIWLGIPNVPDSLRRKFVRIHIEGTALNLFNTTYEPEGYKTGDISQPVTLIGKGGGKNNSNEYDLNWAFEPQPRWERLRLQRKNGGDVDTLHWDQVRVESMCSDAFWEDPFLRLHDSSLEAAGLAIGLWPVVLVFPQLNSVSVSPPAFSAPPSTGAWTSAFVYTDPDGNPRPGGGVRFTSNGAGLTTADRFNADIRINGGDAHFYDVYAYESNEGRYEHYVVRTGDLNLPAAQPWTLLAATAAMMAAGAWFLRRRAVATWKVPS